MAYIGNTPAEKFSAFSKQDFTTSATTSYTLDNPVSNANEIALFINHVRQEPTTAYTASGTSLTLTSATAATDDMYCVYLGKAVQTVNPANGSVDTAQLADDAVETAKINDSAITTVKIADDAITKAKTSSLMYPAFQAKLSADQTLTNQATTKVQFNTEVFDTDSTYDNSTNYRFTPGVAGKYYISAQADFEGSNITANWIYIYKNGAKLWGSHHDSSNHTYTTQCVSTIVESNTTDYFEIYVYLDTTGTPKIKADFGGVDVSFFCAYRIGD